MVYGPIAAFLVEMFPTKIRYTSMSLPYHIGNGWFGGMLPLLATAIVAATGDIYAGLWYPIGVSVLTLAIGLIFLKDTRGVDITTSSGVSIQKAQQLDLSLRKQNRLRITPRPVLLSAGNTRKLQHDLTAMRPGAMLDQVDRLPRAQRKFASEDRDMQRCRRQHGLDVRGHVIEAFGIVAPSGVLGRQPVERCRQILEHRRIGVFLYR